MSPSQVLLRRLGALALFLLVRISIPETGYPAEIKWGHFAKYPDSGSGDRRFDPSRPSASLQ